MKGLQPLIKLHIYDTNQDYYFYTQRELEYFLELIDLSEFKDWYARVIK